MAQPTTATCADSATTSEPVSIGLLRPPAAIRWVQSHPRDPDLAVIEPGIINEALVLPGFGALAILFGIAALIFIVPAVSRKVGR